MKVVSYSKKWALFTFVLSSLFLLPYIYEGLFSINNWLYHTTGDSLKNYFNVLQAAKHANGLWLNNANYPFGEQLFFLDSQPFLAKFLGFLNLEKYTIGFVNCLPFLSISLSSVPIFLIQRELKVNLLLNIFTAIIIAFLAPQIGRITVHFALSYGVFIPTLLYFTIAKFKLDTIRYLLIFIWLLLFSFLHPYYLLIGIVLYSALLFYHIFFQFSFQRIFLNLLVIILPLLVIKLVLFYTDPVLDRPEVPFGIWQYRSTFSSVFTPKFKPFIELIPGLNLLPKGTFEGNAYVGILGFPVLLITIYRIFEQLKNKKRVQYIFRTEKFFYLFFASLTIWIFALYYPLKAIIDPIMELIPILKQFRSLGRFGWIFYFVFSIFITISLEQFYYFLKSKTTGIFSFSVLVVLVAIWYLDANSQLSRVKEALEKKQTTSFNDSKFLTTKELNSFKKMESFNAILSLPIFAVGSEIKNYLGSGYGVYETYILSNVLNLPYTSTYSSRVSASQFYKVKALKECGSLQAFYTKKENLLIIADTQSLNDCELEILKRSEVLYKKDNMVYAKFKVDN